jgi:hypothetical protein
MVIIVIFWPQLVTMFLDKPLDFDPDKVKIELEQPDYDKKGGDLQDLFKPQK